MPRTASLVSVLLLTLLTSAATAQEEPEEVFVVNWPEIQQITGAVQLAAPAPQARLFRLPETIVAPVSPDDTTALVAGGVIRAEGFVSAVLSLGGRMRAEYFQAGRVGAVLIPDEPELLQAFEEEGRALFALRVEAEIIAGGGVSFGSEQPLVRLGFPRYRVYYYNTTDGSAAVTLYVNLVN